MTSEQQGPGIPPGMIMAKVRGYMEGRGDDNQKDMEAALDDHIEEYEQQLREDLQRGLGPLKGMSAEEKHAIFMNLTDERDVGRLTSPDVDVLISAIRQAGVRFASVWWAQATLLSDFSLRYLINQFRAAYRKEVREVEKLREEQRAIQV